jgi:GH35 family endo-1,4-beta-xylanase
MVRPMPSSTPTAAITPGPTPTPSIKMSAQDAAAVAQAEADIEKNRQGEAIITVVDSQGRPLPGLSVDYTQIEHSFLFGVFDTYDPQVFALMREAGLNHVTFHYNWAAVEPRPGQYTWDNLDFAWGVQDLRDRGFHLKGHALIWLQDTTPTYMRYLPFESYKKAVYRHVYDTVDHYQDEIELWEAINEPMSSGANEPGFDERQIIDITATSAKAIRAAAPQARIIINNASCGGEDKKGMYPYHFLQGAIEAGVDFDIVGLQLYYNSYTWGYDMPRRSLASMGQVLDEYAALGKEVHVTEFSAPSTPLKHYAGYWGQEWSEELQAAYLRAGYTIFFSKPHVQAITWWDANDDSSFVYHGGLLGEENRPKPSYYALKELIRSWTTNGHSVTDARGQVVFRGFGGVYQVTVTDRESGLDLSLKIAVKERQSHQAYIVFDREGISDKRAEKQRQRELALRENVRRAERLLTYWQKQGEIGRMIQGGISLYRIKVLLRSGALAAAEEALHALLNRLAVEKTTIIAATTMTNTNKSLFSNLYDLPYAFLWTNGALYLDRHFDDGQVEITVMAKGKKGGREWPRFVVAVGGRQSRGMAVDTRGWKNYKVALEVEGGYQRLALIFVNDYYDQANDQDRNLYIKEIQLTERSWEAPQE